MHSTCVILWQEEEWLLHFPTLFFFEIFSDPCMISMMHQYCANTSNPSTLFVRWARNVVGLYTLCAFESRYPLCNPACLTSFNGSVLQPVASTINTLAGALYKVFCASPDPARKEMREACFDYLSLGGICSTGPVSLLSGLNPRPLHLVVHFFAVAVFGVGRLMLPFPSPYRIWLGIRLILVCNM